MLLTIVSVTILIILIFALGYGVGFVKGFKESKEIDDKIIKELGSKYGGTNL